MNILKITHNAGFFSCFAKRLEGIVSFFNTRKCAPDNVDSTAQFALYKVNPADDLVPLYFKDNAQKPSYARKVRFHNDYQFLDYKDVDLIGLQPFIDHYFSPSDHVIDIVSQFEQKYQFDYSHTCAVFYRGNDKSTETTIAPYQDFIIKAQEIHAQYPDVVFLVQTDEVEFLEAFMVVFPTAIYIEETPRINKKVSTVHDEMPVGDRAEFGARFFAATLVLSKCKHLITHTGNCGLWCVLYRGTTTGVYQWIDRTWKRSKTDRLYMRIKIEINIALRNILKGTIGWTIE